MRTFHPIFVDDVTPEDSTKIVEIRYALIPAFKGYCVGDDGSVWSRRIKIFPKGKGRVGSVSALGDTWKRLKPTRCGSKNYPTNYQQVLLSSDRKSVHQLVHRLVLLAFAGQPNEGEECAHLDNNRENNRLSNLMWKTKKENQADRVRFGTDGRGERAPVSKVTNKQAIEIRELAKQGYKTAVIAKQFCISCCAVRRIVLRKTFRYAEEESERAKSLGIYPAEPKKETE